MADARWTLWLWLATLVAGCNQLEKLTEAESNGGSRASQIKVSADPRTVPAGGSATIRVEALRSDGQPVDDGTRIQLTASSGHKVNPSSVETRAGGTGEASFRAGETPGEARVEAASGTARSALTLSVVPREDREPAPAGAPPRSAGSASAIDLAQVVWVDPDVSRWPETSRITSVSIGDPPLCIDHTRKGQWPIVDGLEGNPWIFVNLDGRWHAATYEWLAPGQVCKGIHRDNIGPHIGRAPLSSWRPRSGELVGLMVSARARFRADTVAERSNVVMVRWP